MNLGLCSKMKNFKMALYDRTGGRHTLVSVNVCVCWGVGKAPTLPRKLAK